MKKFFIVLVLSLVLAASLCGCLQWLEIPDEHYSQASLVEAPKKESPLLGLSYFLSPIFARLLFICLTRLFKIVTLSSFAIPSDAHAAQYKRISPYPIGDRYSVVRQNLPLSLRFAPFGSGH